MDHHVPSTRNAHLLVARVQTAFAIVDAASALMAANVEARMQVVNNQIVSIF